uniref:Uncharacterized protein n=1 Tax=Aegilops tauschii subsp. strangulata TaxID=200361 RepID=A0A453FGJ7_AEGTS
QKHLSVFTLLRSHLQRHQARGLGATKPIGGSEYPPHAPYLTKAVPHRRTPRNTPHTRRRGKMKAIGSGGEWWWNLPSLR